MEFFRRALEVGFAISDLALDFLDQNLFVVAHLFLYQFYNVFLGQFVIFLSVIFLILEFFQFVYDFTQFWVVEVVEQSFPFLEGNEIQVYAVVFVILAFKFGQKFGVSLLRLSDELFAVELDAEGFELEMA